MKKLSILFLFLLPFLLTLQSGCSLMNSIFPDAEFDAELEAIIEVSSEDASRAQFGKCVTVNPKNQDDNLNKYADRIKELRITEVTGTVIDTIYKEFILMSGNLTINNQFHQTGWSFIDEDIYVGKSLTLDNMDGQWDVTNQILNDGLNPFSVCLNGMTDVDTVYFRYKVVWSVSGKADPF